MKDSAYLIITENGIVGMKKRIPSLDAGEYAIMVTLNVPDSYFDVVYPEAVLNVTEEHLVKSDIHVKLNSAEEHIT